MEQPILTHPTLLLLLPVLKSKLCHHHRRELSAGNTPRNPGRLSAVVPPAHLISHNLPAFMTLHIATIELEIDIPLVVRPRPVLAAVRCVSVSGIKLNNDTLDWHTLCAWLDSSCRLAVRDLSDC